KARDQDRPEGWMIDVRISGDDQDVERVPAPGLHLLPRGWQKGRFRARWSAPDAQRDERHETAFVARPAERGHSGRAPRQKRVRGRTPLLERVEGIPEADEIGLGDVSPETDAEGNRRLFPTGPPQADREQTPTELRAVQTLVYPEAARGFGDLAHLGRRRGQRLRRVLPRQVPKHHGARFRLLLDAKGGCETVESVVPAPASLDPISPELTKVLEQSRGRPGARLHGGNNTSLQAVGARPERRDFASKSALVRRTSSYPGAASPPKSAPWGAAGGAAVRPVNSRPACSSPSTTSASRA